MGCTHAGYGLKMISFVFIQSNFEI